MSINSNRRRTYTQGGGLFSMYKYIAGGLNNLFSSSDGINFNRLDVDFSELNNRIKSSWEIDKVVCANDYPIVFIAYNGESDYVGRKALYGEVGYINEEWSYSKLMDNMLFQGHVNNHVFMKPDYALGGTLNKKTNHSVYIYNLNEFKGNLSNVWKLEQNNSYYYCNFCSRGLAVHSNGFMILPGRIGGAIYGDTGVISVLKPPYTSKTFVELPSSTIIAPKGGCTDMNDKSTIMCALDIASSENSSMITSGVLNYSTGRVGDTSILQSGYPHGRLGKYAIGISASYGYINDPIIRLMNLSTKAQSTRTIPDFSVTTFDNLVSLTNESLGGFGDGNSNAGITDLLGDTLYIHGVIGSGISRLKGLWYMKEEGNPVKCLNEVVNSIAMSNLN